MYFLWYDVTPQVKEWVAGVKQVLILFFSPEVAHSDFPASQVSVQEHWKHLKVRYGVHKLWVEMKTCINTLCLAKVVTFFAIYNVKTTIIFNDFYYFILTLYDNEVECEEKTVRGSQKYQIKNWGLWHAAPLAALTSSSPFGLFLPAFHISRLTSLP